MLRLRYKERTTVFEFRGVEKKDAREIIGNHLVLFSQESHKQLDGTYITRLIPPSELIAEWQDGEDWKDDAPTETIPVT